MIDPNVTVFIPVYNGEAYLLEAIESILNQSFTNFELLIIDDGSIDRSMTIIESFKDDRIRLLQNSDNKGISFTRNRAIKEAKGNYLALLDADDIALPTRLEKQVNYLNTHPDVAMCGSHATVINNDGVETGESILVPVNCDQIKVGLIFENTFVNSSVMFRTNVLREANGYYNGLCEDYEMVIRLNSVYRLGNIDDVLIKYRRHGSNISKVFAEKMSAAEKYIILCIQQQLYIEDNQKYVDVHHAIMTNIGRGIHLTRDYENLLLVLREANRVRKIYPIERLNKLLFVLFYERLRIENKRNALFQFFKTPLFQWGFVSFKMVRKMIKQNLWNRD